MCISVRLEITWIFQCIFLNLLNIDNAFSRRIQSVLNFTIPDFTERKILWKNALNGISNINEKQVHSIAREYEITGGSIKNIIQYSWLLSKRNNQKNVEGYVDRKKKK